MKIISNFIEWSIQTSVEHTWELHFQSSKKKLLKWACSFNLKKEKKNA